MSLVAVQAKRAMRGLRTCYAGDPDEKFAARQWAYARLYYYLTGNVVNWEAFAEHRGREFKR